MILFNTTRTEEDDTLLINELVGKPFSFFEAIKMGGVGSGRFIIESASRGFYSVLKTPSDLNYLNIELRPMGVILHFTQQLKRYAWVIPYRKLVIYNTKTFGLHSDNIFLELRKNQLFKSNMPFIEKMLSMRLKYLNKYKFYDRPRN
ncbi:hypothetical protein [Pseudofulvibacter geojedonensis]|uniref:Uncharacterized protein n=1 Tax=Pseudofulvibacter geojedonensis TaxID=1123758 RepID=A0ABW3I3I6_9FLAO